MKVSVYFIWNIFFSDFESLCLNILVWAPFFFIFFYYFFFVLFFIVLRVAFYTIFLHSNFTKKKDFIGKAILVLGINISFSLQVRLLDLEGCFISSAMSEFILELLMRTLGSVIQLESCINKLPDFWHFTKGPFMNCQNQYLYKTENSFSLNCFKSCIICLFLIKIF